MPAFDRILVTGAAGFVGAHLATALAQSYPRARLVALLRPGERNRVAAFAGVSAELTDEAAIDRLIAELRPDLVAHLAGQASAGAAAQAAEQAWRVNFHGSFGLAAAIARHVPQATMLFASTATAYGLSFRDGVLTEEAPLRPLDVYSRTKAATESALADVLAPTNRLIIARPVNHSGPGQRSRNFVLSSFAAQIAAIEAGDAPPRLQVGDLSKSRDFLDVRDVVDAYMRLIAAASDLPDRVSIFNVASGESRSIGALLDILRARATAEFSIDVDPQLMRPTATDIARVACDSGKLRAATGWRPQHPVDDMLADLLDDWRAARASDGAS